MKAVVLHEADDMRVEARPVPKPDAGEVLLKVNVTSICGTDVKVLHRTLMGQPAGEFIMGHEYAGTVAALGPDVDEFRVGDRVAVEVHKGCERCENCVKGWYTSCLNYGNLAKGHRAKGLTCDGGFAEYAVNHVNTLYKLPDNLTFEQACMVTTAASPLWAIDLMGGYLAGETVLVQGPGPIGLLAVQLCKALGAERVILSGTRPERLQIGGRLGADVLVNVREESLPRRVAEVTGGKGADSVLECAGGPTSMQEALESVKRGGRIGVVAWYAGPVEMDMNLAVRSNVRIYAARGEGGMNSGRSLALMSAGKLLADPIITHHFALDLIQEENMRKRLAIMTLGILLAVAAAGMASAQIPRRSLVIGMPVTPPNLPHIGVYIAKELGYFDEQGINVELTAFESGLQSLRGGIAGGVDVVAASSEPIVTVISRGAKIRTIFSYAHRLTVVMAAQDSIRK